MTWKPEVFQGWGRSKNYFEGWYFKLVTATQDRAIALIPGVSYSDRDAHAFLQVLDGTNTMSNYYRLELESFKPDSENFDLRLAGHRFSASGITLDHEDIHGSVRFSNPTRWQGSLLRPGIMGWYSFVPFMQCYHGLVSINHRVEGKLKLHDQEIDFTGGKGYIEKDWGSSFPKAWIWTQCNHFDGRPDLSVMASVAHIPWLGSHFIGFLALIWDGSSIKIFTTYTGAEMKAMLAEDQVTLCFRDRHEELTIRAKMAPGIDLVSPILGEMVGKINESLQASQSVQYRSRDRQLLDVKGTSAGLEVSEGHQMLLTQIWRK